MTKEFFPNLDGLRFFAFFLVFWQHAFVPLMETLQIPADYKHYFVTGGLGVSFFFVLSGFLITYLLLKENAKNGFINIKAFYVRRILRILPLYYAVLAFGFLLYPLMRYLLHLPPQDNGNPVLYILFLGNFDVMSAALDRPSFVGILWSLAIEEQFYIFWVLLLVIVPRKLYIFLILLVIIVSTAFRALQTDEKILYFHTLSVISDLGIGAAMAYLAFNKPSFTAFFKRLSKLAIAAIYVLGIALVFVFPNLFNAAIQRIVFSLFFAFVIAEQNYSDNSFYKMSNFKRISFCGVFTYGLYMLHPIVFYFINLAAEWIGIEKAAISTILMVAAAGLALSIAAAAASFYIFEKPVLKFKQRFEV